MKFHIATELQKRWVADPPEGWIAAKERDLLTSKERAMLGYRPLVDLVLTNSKSNQRLWIELEISRADPVANHTKFASAHLLHPIAHQDAFISLISNHVTRGRANLAAHTIYLLRRSGIRAFQIPLLNHLGGNRICAINQGMLPLSELPTPDLNEVISLTNAISEDFDDEIYYVTNRLEVILNVRQWNKDALNDQAKPFWGSRRVKYLIFDKRAGLFAPSKFCAYTRIFKPSSSVDMLQFNPAMTINCYSRVPQNLGIFDGQKAWKRLSKIGFQKFQAADVSGAILKRLKEWSNANSELVTIDPQCCEILMEP